MNVNARKDQKLNRSTSYSRSSHIGWWREVSGIVAVAAWVALLVALVLMAVGILEPSTVWIVAGLSILVIALLASSFRDRQRKPSEDE